MRQDPAASTHRVASRERIGVCGRTIDAMIITIGTARRGCERDALIPGLGDRMAILSHFTAFIERALVRFGARGVAPGGTPFERRR